MIHITHRNHTYQFINPFGPVKFTLDFKLCVDKIICAVMWADPYVVRKKLQKTLRIIIIFLDGLNIV